MTGTYSATVPFTAIHSHTFKRSRRRRRFDQSRPYAHGFECDRISVASASTCSTPGRERIHKPRRHHRDQVLMVFNAWAVGMGKELKEVSGCRSTQGSANENRVDQTPDTL
jgi:hypothetical protein